MAILALFCMLEVLYRIQPLPITQGLMDMTRDTCAGADILLEQIKTHVRSEAEYIVHKARQYSKATKSGLRYQRVCTFSSTIFTSYAES